MALIHLIKEIIHIARVKLLSKWILIKQNIFDGDQRAHPKILTMQINEGESHLTVTVPSTSLSQKQDPERLRPQSAFCMMIQLAMNLKFLFLEVIFLRI